jgi:hypothetical protein
MQPPDKLAAGSRCIARPGKGCALATLVVVRAVVLALGIQSL